MQVCNDEFKLESSPVQNQFRGAHVGYVWKFRVSEMKII
eukprot:COSAG02_NODE_425_length_22574_cov_29.550300_6_plen_39_part_00